MQVMHARELSRRLHDRGVTNITVNSLHPGFVDTNLTRNGSWLMQTVMSPIKALFAFNETDGAKTQIYLATSTQVEGVTGKYFE